MTKVFNTNQIKVNDLLREKKINALNSIKDYLQGITEGEKANGLLSVGRLDVKPELSILEKHLWRIIRQYELGFQKEDSELQEITSQYPDFKNNWYEVIVNSNDSKEINKIKNVVIKALLKCGGELTQGLIIMENETKECWIRTFTDEESEKARKGWMVLPPESSQVLREKLAKFDAKFFGNFKDTEWEKILARDILRDVLLAKIEKVEHGEKGARDAHNSNFKRITNAFQNAKFSKTRTGDWKIDDSLEDYKESESLGSFRAWMKQQIESDNLREKWLPEGQKKADLLRKLETFIQEKTNGNNNNDNLSKNSSDASVNNDNISKPSASEPAKNEWEKLLEETKNKVIKRIVAALQSAGLSKSDLNPEYQNWEQQINLAVKEGSATKIQDIESQLLADINNKKEVKEKEAELDNLLQKFSSQNKTVNDNEFKEALNKVNKNLGDQENETKSQAVKEAMREKDPTLYFEAFVNWVKGEMKVCEMKNDELEEKERKLIEGKITDPNEIKQIEKGLEEKVAAKSQSWSFSQKLSEWQRWLKEKAARIAIDHFEGEARKIKQQIYNLKLSSNSLKKQAYKNNETKANQLLAELNAFSQKKQSVTPSEKSFFRPSVVIPTALIGAGLMIIFLVAVRKRKLVKKQ